MSEPTLANAAPVPATPTAPAAPAPSAPVAGPPIHLLTNPASAVTDVVASIAAPKTQRSAEEVLEALEGRQGGLGTRKVRCILKHDHPLDHTTYGGVQFAKFTEIVANGGAIRIPQPGALNELTQDDVERIVADARFRIGRFYPGGKTRDGEARRGRGHEYDIRQVGEKYAQGGDRPSFVPPRVLVGGQKKFIPLWLSDADAAKALGVSPIDVNEARREADVRSLIALEFDPAPQAEIPDSLERALEMARKNAQEAVPPLPRRGDAGPSQGVERFGIGGMAVGGTRLVGEDSISDEAVAAKLQAELAADAKATGIPQLQPSPDMAIAKDVGIKLSGTGKPRR